jgi:squalene-hopene/tetraprenyl-beta-curcumene cyclase
MGLFALTCRAAVSAAAAVPQAPAAPAAPPPGSLDPRIDPARITESEPPPLPQQVLMPLPPVDRIASSPDDVPIERAAFERAVEALRRGVDHLERSQGPDGGWMHGAMAAPSDAPDRPTSVSIAVTAMCLKALAQAGSAEGEAARRAQRVVRAAQRPDGSFAQGLLDSYVTSIVVSGLCAVDRWLFADEIRAATDWLQSAQWDQGEGLSARQDWYGGVGYGNRGRPDLSNTQMMIEALYEAGMSPDEPAFQRAVAFVSRAQNLKSVNPAPWAGDDGGFVYTPANGGESMASEAAGEGRGGEKLPEGTPRLLRSYGSMTYAGFKSLLHAGLSANDLRVRSAFDWIRRHFTFDENPGMGQQGLYYYYLVMARALVVAQQDHVTDIHGATHNWREELIAALLRRQREDGSWRNDADRWLEGEPVLATAYAVLALEEALKPVSRLR